jgi:hypothetical protein
MAYWSKRYVLRYKNVVDVAAVLTKARPYMTIKADMAARAMTRAAEWARLNEAVEERNRIIRADFAAGTKGKDLAKRFLLSPQAISMIINGHEWASVKPMRNIGLGKCGGARVKNLGRVHALPGEPAKPFDESRADIAAMPQDVFLAYLAAVIDGEGCIQSAKKPTPRLDVTNTDRPFLDAIHLRVGVGSIYVSHDHPERGWKKAYKWMIQNAAGCLAVCEAVLPYLQIKTDKAKEAITVIRDKFVAKAVWRERIISLAVGGATRREVQAATGSSPATIKHLVGPGHEWPNGHIAAAKRRHRDEKGMFSHSLPPQSPCEDANR